MEESLDPSPGQPCEQGQHSGLDADQPGNLLCAPGREIRWLGAQRQDGCDHGGECRGRGCQSEQPARPSIDEEARGGFAAEFCISGIGGGRHLALGWSIVALCLSSKRPRGLISAGDHFRRIPATWGGFHRRQDPLGGSWGQVFLTPRPEKRNSRRRVCQRSGKRIYCSRFSRGYSISRKPRSHRIRVLGFEPR